MCHHHDIRPVERDCICLERLPAGPHIAACESAYRVKFFGSWRNLRCDLQAAAAGREVTEAFGAPSMN
jgi:hypothetical protein